MPLFTPDVKRLNANRDVMELTKALSYKGDPKVRADAVRALVEIGDFRALNPLHEALKEEEVPYVRYLYAEALIKLISTTGINKLDGQERDRVLSLVQTAKSTIESLVKNRGAAHDSQLTSAKKPPTK